MLEYRCMLAVVISELMAENDSVLADADGDYSDWIEIRNESDSDVDLDGWYLTDDPADLSKWRFPQMNLAGRSHLVVFASGKDRTSSSSELHTDFKLAKSGEYLALVRPDGVSVEHAFSPTFPPQLADVSYGLAQDGQSVGYFLTPTPGSANLGVPISDPTQAVVINEIMYSLPHDGLLQAENTDEEFIELYNRGTTSVDVTGWRLTRGVELEFPAATIPSGGFLVVAANVGTFQAKYPGVTNVIGGWTGRLSNNGETIEVVDAAGRQIDQVRYASQGDWSVRAEGPDDRGSRGWVWSSAHDGGLKSLELINVGLPRTSGQNWTASELDGGTPGRPNSRTAQDSAPLIVDVIHAPAVPTASDPVRIMARLIDELPQPEAWVHWRVDTAAAFNKTKMTLDVSSTADSGQTMVAELPAHANRTVIEFFVEATDNAGNRRTWPAPTAGGAQSANALYQVIDEFDQSAPWNPEDVPVYFQIMTTAERQQFTNTVRQSDAQYNATFISVSGSGVDVRYNAGVRYRGSASRNDAVPPNRINLPNDRSWQGITRINMNPGNPANNVAGSALFRLAGIEMADARGVRMLSNGVNLSNGLYAHIEVLDDDYASRHYPLDSDGNVYRGRRPDESPPGGRGAGLRYFGEDPAPYVSYIKNTNSSVSDWSDVIRMTDALNNSPNETFVDDVQQWIDVRQWFRALAMNSLVGNDEYGLFTGDAQGDDYAMYRGFVDQRFQMIPYDLDSLFVTGGFGGGQLNAPLDEAAGVPALNRLINFPEFRQQYYAEYLDLIENVIHTDDVEEVLRQSLRGVASEARIREMLDFLDRRAQFVLDAINQDLSIAANVPTVSGLPRATSSLLELSGQAPEAGTVSVTVNGHPVDTIDAERNWSFNLQGNQIVHSTSLLSSGSVWRYRDDGSDQGVTWRNVAFDDSSWQQGPSQLGYGDGDEVTTISNGPGPGNSATAYFRTHFSVPDLAQAQFLNLRLVYDDAAAVYVNGVEVVRTDNLAPNAAFDDYALSTRPNQEENNFVSFNANASLLVAGDNVIAVEVHQASANSSDLSFDLELETGYIEIVDRDVPPELELKPGLKRYTVRAFDGPEGTGNLLAEESIDVWYDDGTQQAVPAVVTGDVVWSADEGPYLISGDVTIQAGARVTVEPGTTVFFANGARLNVLGQLVAVGSDDQAVRFTRLPGANAWNGIQFRNSSVDNRIERAILEYGETNDGMIGLENSRLTVEHSLFDQTERRRIRSIDSSLIVRNSTFATIFAPGEAPSTDNLSEHVWGRGIPAGGTWLLEGNVFGHITGHNDSVDFDSNRQPLPIAVIRNNEFQGGGDDALDMTGDVWIEGNTFRNFIKDSFNTDPGESNTISASTGEFWVVRNLFQNVQHASLVKETAFSHFWGNTVDGSEFAPLYFDLPGQTSGPGRGAEVLNSIFSDVLLTFDQVRPETQLTVSHSFLTASDEQNFAGNGNLFGSPHLNSDSSLGRGSFAIGAGTNRQDMGFTSLAGATLAGVPAAVTDSTRAQILVGGAGITHYRYRLNGGGLGSEQPVSQPIELNNLVNGEQLIEVVGKNSLGEWQVVATKASWTVNTSLPASIVLSEVLANNVSIAHAGQIADLIELHNPTTKPFDLSGYGLSDDRSVPGRYVFPANTIVPGGGYLVLVADPSLQRAGSVGFGLDADGEGVYLFDRTANRNLVDAVEFGAQLPDLSISRLSGDAEWGLSKPTFGQPNVAYPVSDGTSVVINEWYADGEIRIEEDFVELFNRAEFPADLGEFSLSDRPFAIPDMSRLAPLSFVDAGGYLTLIADGRDDGGRKQVNFGVSPNWEQLGLYSATGAPIDVVFSPHQTSEYSMGRVPDGAGRFQFQRIPTPDATNGRQDVVSVSWGINDNWKYEVSGTDLGTAWRESAFDDSNWSEGRTLIGRSGGFFGGIPIATPIALGPITFYFRKSFTLDEQVDLDKLAATVSAQVDDGYVVYVNGTEVLRRRMPNGTIRYSTLASQNVNNATIEGPFALPREVFVAGENVIAVEVHQNAANSSDVAFGLALDATAELARDNTLETLVDGLRITELMYHAPQGSELDFIELANIADVPLDLEGVRLSDAVDYTFPPFVLAPGQFVVVASDLAAFRSHYGELSNLVGEYDGNLDNGGESVALLLPSPFDAAILRFEYRDDWYPTTDGGGKSLESADARLRFDHWSEADAWRASIASEGSPGFGSIDGQVPGDLNQDQIVNIDDVDLLCASIRGGHTEGDLDSNGVVDLADMEFLIERILGTSIGDANLDGVFNSRDFIDIFLAGEYEDEIAGNSTWREGDWNCDGDFSTRDMIYAFLRGNYSQAAVPDRVAPTTSLIVPSTVDASVEETREPIMTERKIQEPDSRQRTVLTAMHVDQWFANDRTRKKVSDPTRTSELTIDVDWE